MGAVSQITAAKAVSAKAVLRAPPKLDVLAKAWRDLEGRADRPFFLSWTWIEAWLATLAEQDGPKPMLLEATHEGRVVGLALFVERHDRPRLLPFKRGLLHATAVAGMDVICQEHNGILCERGYERAVWAAAIDACETAHGWEEVQASMVRDVDADAIAVATEDAGWICTRRDAVPSALVDLAALRADQVEGLDGYLQSLGRSTRQAVRRSMRKYGASGPLVIEAADDVEIALQWFHDAGAAHRARWPNGGYANPFFLAFHSRLITAAFGGGGVELLRARAGDETFAWLYNFKDRGDVLFYQGAFAEASDPHLKPGLTAHALAIGRHIEAGSERYDFLAGDGRYKFNLGSPGPRFERVILQRPGLKTTTEHALSRAKHMTLSGVAKVRKRIAS